MASSALRRLLWVSLFGVSFAFVESAVVVYLRALYYPDGFTFPLALMSVAHLGVELAREAATILMLAAVGIVAGSGGWQRFGFFLVGFGVWDIFYYAWLKAILDWPVDLTEWDVLFLIPLPWIGPVLAPLLVALMMSVCGLLIVLRLDRSLYFRPTWFTWILSLSATAILLYSFMSDLPASLHGALPAPYAYHFLAVGLALYAGAFVTALGPLISPCIDDRCASPAPNRRCKD